VVHDWLQLDGFYAAGLCCLIGLSPDGPVAWQWCDREKHASWAALLHQLPAPRVVVCDGQPGLLSAIADVWPSTVVQRCLVHVLRDVKTNLTTHPRTPAGQSLLRLATHLTRITSIAEAGDWLVTLNAWWQSFGELTTQRTYRVDVADTDVPSWAKPTQTWWYTHARLRRAYRLLTRLAHHGDLFRFLDPALAGTAVPATTNRIEGGINAQLRRLLGCHRGMPPAHQRRAIEWWLWLRWADHPTPASLIRPEHIHPPTPTPEPEPDGPTLWGDSLTAEEGLWARKGWAGRSHR